MTEDRLAIPLTAPERDLIFGLRAVGDSPLRRRVFAVVDGLVRIAREPCCAESQADGVPCDSVHSQCEMCDGVLEKVETLVEKNFPSLFAGSVRTRTAGS
jgi:hypothetical protein